MVIDYEVALGL